MGTKYQVLARKYRPQRFADVIGQQPALTTLKNALRFDQVAHAYLFSGCRGVGKTTLARLLAKALNCSERGADLEPCDQCPSCQDILSGQSLDVIEIDGASNRGIDDIRQINETVGYAPSHGKYKIYIIDEVHMLTKEAFNALLKTLEEPPERVKFFFATTEPHKVLPTILSRCQRFDLLRIDSNQISEKLAQIALDLGREADKDALDLIASFADGSLRDAESIFDQILCFSSERVSASTVRDALGLAPERFFSELDEAFADYRLSYAFELVETLFQAGKDLSHFLEQLAQHYRSICLYKTSGEEPFSSQQLRQRYAKSASLYTQAQALYILDLLLSAEQSMQKSPFPRVTLEATLLHIIRSKNRIPLEVITRRLQALEEALQGKKFPDEPQEISPAAPRLLVPQQESIAPSAFAPEPTAAAPIQASAAPSVFEAEKIQEQTSEPAPVETPSVFATENLQEAPLSQDETKSSAPSVFANQGPSSAPKPASHYETIMRFAAVELEGTLKM